MKNLHNIEARQLTTDELDQVSGGFLPHLAVILVCSAIAVGVAFATAPEK